VKSLRQRPSTTTTLAAQPEFVSATTYRPVNKFIQVTAKVGTTIQEENPIPTTTTKYVPTTTDEPEPELVTASDDEREQIRLYNENQRQAKTTDKDKPTTYKPTLISFKVSSKSAFQVEKKEKEAAVVPTLDSNPTRSSDYDYTYYDTDPESDYSEFVNLKSDKYGKKSNKVIIAKN
jgi:hypothetical protein